MTDNQKPFSVLVRILVNWRHTCTLYIGWLSSSHPSQTSRIKKCRYLTYAKKTVWTETEKHATGFHPHFYFLIGRLSKISECRQHQTLEEMMKNRCWDLRRDKDEWSKKKMSKRRRDKSEQLSCVQKKLPLQDSGSCACSLPLNTWQTHVQSLLIRTKLFPKPIDNPLFSLTVHVNVCK